MQGLSQRVSAATVRNSEIIRTGASRSPCLRTTPIYLAAFSRGRKYSA